MNVVRLLVALCLEIECIDRKEFPNSTRLNCKATMIYLLTVNHIKNVKAAIERKAVNLGVQKGNNKKNQYSIKSIIINNN